MKKINLMIFGLGEVSKYLDNILNLEKVNIKAYVLSDNNDCKVYKGIPIIVPSEISLYEFDYIVVAVGSNYDLALKQMEKIGINQEKIIIFSPNIGLYFKCTYEKLNELYKRNDLNDILKFNLDSLYICNMPFINRSRIDNILDEYTDDYVRLSSLELISNEINKKKLKGNVAELGVYKGEFASCINRLFKDRKLYLFDTFEGFNEVDVLMDNKILNKEFSNNFRYFSDTSVDLVLKKMKYRENCVVKKGYFPETAAGINDKFVFVSIDADLFNPIYEGLKFFYDRLTEGGYIFVHDYNNSVYEGARLAVEKFSKEYNVSYFPLSDYYGTAVFIK